MELTNTESNQEVRSHGTWRGIDPGIVVWKANWARRNWYRFPWRELRMERKLRIIAQRRQPLPCGSGVLTRGEQFAKEKDRYLFQSER